MRVMDGVIGRGDKLLVVYRCVFGAVMRCVSQFGDAEFSGASSPFFSSGNHRFFIQM